MSEYLRESVGERYMPYVGPMQPPQPDNGD